ncbi:23S rRNA (uracil(1939)-C(5))-methyltransferase RlmD [Weissella koreensis]|uniref:23S rRNA (Uracil(1939)-C(5))-methyltransferase RlmD n=1 Tax=Weissella koreensis TaxID=165096 RepID=A0A7H1MLR4_9LACO|nr:23S rRNA (uracil(1939)-C(5))-methyltransferase RlmD [Weissella koreensis]AEJ23563.1 tRNA (uracil-5-)-methyltransferase related enzyme [Weissella koreensis KACC 15510]AVH75196.1 23S rRNA (uracil(1939)-C(5))-methyltransferase RlmD [Weissella koreensis]EJF33610.1 23S rRNA (uracil-5-)-methyltransferase [Weissella koreensis KCTC 3621]MCZ9311057.1 23S rRNA (uracil(1939)-C(5))-methyltransferase RlmD [Weissella koreensis]QGN20421.1 23S rRNA (uracil(1939)-C(5))-methyltransferase RlmD [Weissella kore
MAYNRNPNQHDKPYHASRGTNSASNNVIVKIGDKLLITIKRLGINGEGIGYYKRKITFIPGALPGEVVDVKVTNFTDRFIEAEIRKFKQKSPDRVEPIDDQSVGGFELEHLSYPKQLEFKQDVIRQALEKYKPRGFEDIEIKPTIGMEDPRGYRNKAQFPIRQMKDGTISVGMYQRNSHFLVDLPKVSTQHPATLKVVRKVRDIIDELEIPIYEEKKNTGIIKTLVARVSESTGEVQLTIVTNSDKIPELSTLIAYIHDDLPEVVSIHQNINPDETSLIWGEKTKLLWGSNFITETINGRQFKLSPRAFLQLNPRQTARLYQEALSALDLTHADKLIDAYSGVGTIGISLADNAGEIRGMDTVPESIADANQNVLDNNVTNTKYFVGAAEDLIPQWTAAGWIADAIVVDPPRTGLDINLRNTILAHAPEKFVYISCNESTLARDLVDLLKVYDVEYIQPIDMFPQTARWEGIVKFTKR